MMNATPISPSVMRMSARMIPPTQRPMLFVAIDFIRTYENVMPQMMRTISVIVFDIVNNSFLIVD